MRTEPDSRSAEDLEERPAWGFWTAVGWALLFAGACAAIALAKPAWLEALDARRWFR